MIKQEKNYKKILVMIPASAAFKKERTGIEEYVYQLLKEWIKNKNDKIIFKLYLKKQPLFSFLSKDIFFHTKIIRLPFFWTLIGMSFEMLKVLSWRKFSVNFQRNLSEFVLFIPAHVMPLIHPKRTVVTIHGLEYEYFSMHYSWFSRHYLRWSTRYATKHAWKIIAVSNTTKNDLIRLYGCKPEKIKVIYHGVDRKIPNPKFQISNKFQIPNSKYQIKDNNYFLYLGRIELKKNVLGTIRAFQIFKESQGPEVRSQKLILAGGRGYGYENSKFKIQNSKFRNDIILTGYVGEKEKWALLKNAKALVFPSFYEGFGMPILEAQACGIPVITSDNSAMREITRIKIKNEKLKIKNNGRRFKIKTSALLIDPSKPEEIAEAMLKITSDNSLRKNLIQLGYENVKRFSWEKCGKSTLRVLTD